VLASQIRCYRDYENGSQMTLIEEVGRDDHHGSPVSWL
jgi:hypothetical protein